MQNFTPIDDLVKKHNEMRYGSGSPSKEFEVATPPHEIYEIEASDEQEKTEEVGKYMAPRPQTIKLPPDLKKIGLKAEEEDQFKEALGRIKLPISDEKIMEDLKAPPSESRRWFATILLYILEQAHMTLKRVGTKAVRIFKTN